MSLIVLGVDPSWTATGLAVLEDGKLVHWRTVHTSAATDDMVRAVTIIRDVAEVVKRYRPAVAAIEGYAHGAKAGRERAGELGGILRWSLYLDNLPFEVWPVSRWRKAVLGAKAPREKAQVGMALAQRFKEWAIDDLNALEAAAVAYTAWLRRQPPASWTSYQVQAFAVPKKKARRAA